METTTKPKFCLDCARRGKLAPVWCEKHGYTPEDCQHDRTRQIFIENGEGVACVDCGQNVAIITI